MKSLLVLKTTAGDVALLVKSHHDFIWAIAHVDTLSTVLIELGIVVKGMSLAYIVLKLRQKSFGRGSREVI